MSMSSGAICDWRNPALEPTAWEPHTEEEPIACNDTALEEEIERAQDILENSDAWIEDGVSMYTEATLDRAVAFLKAQSDELRKSHGLHIPVPNIGPGPRGTIDLHWKQKNWELLVNIPATVDQMASFYGDNYGVQKIGGSIDPTAFNLGIANWLMTK